MGVAIAKKSVIGTVSATYSMINTIFSFAEGHMKTRVEMLQEMGVSEADAHQYIGDLEDLLPQYGIADNKQRIAHFFSQILHNQAA